MSEKKSYSTTVYIGTINGKQQRKHVTANSRRELQNKVRQIKQEVAEGKDLRTDSTFGFWADCWYKDVKEPAGLAAGTLNQIRASILHLNAVFEDVEFKNIHFSDFQSFIKEFSSEPLESTGNPPGKRTINSVKHTYNAIAQYASESDIPGAKPFKNVVISKNAPTKERRALTEKEIERIQETEHTAQIAAMIMTFAGLRRGELVPLQWSDVDLDNGLIYVRRFVTVEHSQFTEKTAGKTAAARRIVPMPPVLVDYLIKYREQNKATSLLVYPKVNGGMHSPATFRRTWERYLKLLNYKYGHNGASIESTIGKRDLPMMIEPFTPHYCRHTFATLLYLQGVEVTTAMQYLGHTDIQTTINVYTDLQQYSKLDLPEAFKKKLETDYKIRTA